MTTMTIHPTETIAFLACVFVPRQLGIIRVPYYGSDFIEGCAVSAAPHRR